MNIEIRYLVLYILGELEIQGYIFCKTLRWWGRGVMAAGNNENEALAKVSLLGNILHNKVIVIGT